jgi:hypothetical protein
VTRSGLRVAPAVGFALIGLAVAVAAAYAHVVAGQTLPVPWGDEAYFLYQAKAFSESNSFIAPELDPARPLFLLPFVYGAVVGVVFKVFGYSLTVARWVSFACVMTGFACLAVTVRRHAAPLAAVGLVGLFMINQYFIVLGNVARMEALVFATICVVIGLLGRGNRWSALAVCLLTPMIHPNGMYFLVPMVVYLSVVGTLRTTPSAADRALGLAVMAVWLMNAGYGIAYWDGFLHDQAYRFAQTGAAHEGLSQFSGWAAAELTLILLTGVVGRWRDVAVGHLLVVAVGAWLAAYVRLEQWYEPYRLLVYLLLGLAWMELAGAVVGRALSPARHAAVLAATTAMVLTVGLFYAGGILQGPVNYLDDMEVSGMRIDRKDVYFAEADREALRAVIGGLETSCGAVVEVWWMASDSGGLGCSFPISTH